MNDDNLTYFEKRLLAELEGIETQIKSLDTEKRALQRQLSKARAERTGLQTATRKNSLNRVLAENSIIEALREKKRPLSTRQLYLNALITHFDLKETTFRSYLHRMKKRGDIKTGGHVGTWELIPKK